MGNDGTAGMRAIREVGGHTIVQDPETCVMDSMVRSVIDAGLTDELLKPEKIAGRIEELAQ
jgi:two-component system, chemotaxis family, CheB/CheR fusion protein